MRIAQMEEDVYSGLPSTIEIEKQTNPFFRCHKKPVIDHLKERNLIANSSGESVLGALRQLRDEFDG